MQFLVALRSTIKAESLSGVTGMLLDELAVIDVVGIGDI